tara:strand:+ start:264 stop:1271 length:1008 start_codon:yes stop_codon:yes gene_type:complete
MKSFKSYIIAEIGQAHDGSLGFAHSYIDALSKTGVDAIKFQTHIAEAESSKYEKFRTNFSYEDKCRYDYWKRMEFSLEQWKGLKNHCTDKGVDFISSPFSCKAVDILEQVGVKKYKIGSGEINNYLMLEKIAKTKKPIILSSGMSDTNELKNSLKFLSNYNSDISLLHCTTSYPTKETDWTFNMINELKNEFKIPIGFSDHSGIPSTCLAARCFGAEILEFHAIFHKSSFGPDNSSSLTIEEIKLMVNSIRKIERSFKTKKIDKSTRFNDIKVLFGKSLAINKNLKKGHKLKFEDLESKKPYGKGIDCRFYSDVIGKYIKRNMKKWDFLNKSDID